MIDIYFDENYGKLYEKVEKGKAIVWKYEGKEGKVCHQFLLREIPIDTLDGPWFDLVTPYGYGGPVVEEVCAGYEKTNVVKAFYIAFEKYCKEQKIVSEFVRFHPLIGNGIDFKDVYHSELNRYTLGTNLKDFADPIQEEFSKSCRKTIRQALNKGISFKMTKSPENLGRFIEIYYLNMQRKDAGDFYFFPKEYFNEILKNFKENILLAEAVYEGKTVAAGLYFLYDGTIHAHLSGTDSVYLSLSPAYILKYGTAIWGKENHCKVIHYGGGTSPSQEDPLFLFKKKFAQHTEFPFYIGKKIWDQETYQKLCELKGCAEDEGFFPAYRAFC